MTVYFRIEGSGQAQGRVDGVFCDTMEQGLDDSSLIINGTHRHKGITRRSGWA